MSFTNYLEHKVLDHLFGATTYTPSGTWYLGLSTTTPAEDGTSFTEPASASGYSRASMTNDKTNWSNAAQTSTSGEVYNNTTVTFPTSSGNWGTVTHFGIFDHATTGNLLIMAPLTNQQTVNTNNQLSFTSGTLRIRID